MKYTIGIIASLVAATPALAGPTEAIAQCNALYRPGDATSVQAQNNCLRTVESISADMARARTETIRENSRYGQTVVREGSRYAQSRNRNGTDITREIIRAIRR
jgi:hypothetical protein